MCICLCVRVCGGGGRSDKIGICFTFSFSCCALSVLFLLPKLCENNLGLWRLATPEPTLQDCETTPTETPFESDDDDLFIFVVKN